MLKKSTLAALVAASILPAAASADSVVYGAAKVFYGQDTINKIVDPTAVKPKAKDESAFVMQSTTSRVGLKGTTELTGGLTAVYKFEYGVDPIEGNGIAANRDNIVGLTGAFGTVAMGTSITPLVMAQGGVDIFDDYFRADSADAQGRTGSESALGRNNGDQRVGNVFYYGSPKIADALQFHVALVPGERHGVKNADGIADVASLAAIYGTDQLHLALAHDAVKDFNRTRLAAQFKADMFGVGAMYQFTEDKTVANTKDEVNGYLVSGYVNATDALQLKLQYVGSNDEVKVGNAKAVETDNTQVSAGVDYKFGEYTTGTFYVTQFKQDLDSKENKANAGQFVGVGLMHSF